MPRLPGLAPVLFGFLLFAGCVRDQSGPGVSPDVTPNAIAGDAIEVTALDGGPPPEGAADAGPLPEPESPAVQSDAVPEAEMPEAEPAAETGVAAPPAEPKSEAQLACEKKRGRWTSVGSTLLRTCIFTTKDSGKQCSRSTDCESACLARSGTCAPFKPLLGCNEILQDNGARVTQCIE